MKSTETLEAELRQQWTLDGVPESKQTAILADVARQAQPGAAVGPFVIGATATTTPMHLETMTLTDLNADRARLAAQQAARDRRESMLARMDRPIAGGVGTLQNGVLFETEENLFSGTAAERTMTR